MNNVELWIAVNGNDNNDGTEERPLATVEKALEITRSLKYQKAFIHFKGGKYFWDKPVILSAVDHDIYFQSAEGENPEICGAFPIEKWEEVVVNGINMWVTEIAEEKCNFRSMFKDEKILSRSRWPKTGFFAVKDALDEEGCGIHDKVYKDDPNVRMNYAMYVNSDNLMEFKNKTDVTVRVVHYWKDELVNVKEIDLDNGHIVFSRPATMTIKSNDRFYYENVWEAFSEPGEWYMDRSTGKLYYIPESNDDINTTKLYAAQTEKLVICSGASNIHFDNIEFKMTDWSIPKDTFSDCGADHHQAAYDAIPAFFVENTDGICFNRCYFSKIMANCLKFAFNVQNISVTNNRFENLGANAIYIVGQNLEKTDLRVTRKFKIFNNKIGDFGRHFLNATAIGILHAMKGEISNNEIHDGYYTGITLGWVWGYGYSVTSDILVKRNHIYNIGLNLLSDMGAVYTLGVKEGIVITENVIHNVKANLDYGYGGWGIYTDEGSSNVLITKNLVYDCNSTAFYQHYGRDNLVINNILAFAEEGQVSSFRNQPHVGFHLIRNIIVSNGSEFVSMKDIVEQKIRGRFNDANNVYYDYQSKDRGIDVEWYQKELGLYNTPTFVDPKFKNWEERDFNFEDDTPVFELGFIPWDISKAGVIEE